MVCTAVTGYDNNEHPDNSLQLEIKCFFAVMIYFTLSGLNWLNSPHATSSQNSLTGLQKSTLCDTLLCHSSLPDSSSITAAVFYRLKRSNKAETNVPSHKHIISCLETVNCSARRIKYLDLLSLKQFLLMLQKDSFYNLKLVAFLNSSKHGNQT